MIAERLTQLGIDLPPVSPPVGNYVGCVVVDDFVHVGGHGPVGGPERFAGKVGTDLTLEDGYRAARATGLSILATLAAELGDLDRIDRMVKVFGMVNVAPGFNRTPEVVDGCSNLLVEVFGLSLIHISEPTRQAEISYAVFC